jgi:SPP1 gp7 family putative phage head morphogenesis protein
MALPIGQLRDTLTRHQIYLEQVKVYEGLRFSVVLSDLNKDLTREFKALSFDTMDQMTKAQLSSFLRKLSAILGKQFNAYAAQVVKRIRAFMEVDHSVLSDCFEEIDGRLIKRANDEEKNKLPFGFLAAIGSVRGYNYLWGKIANSPIPATGQTIAPFISNNISAFIPRILNLVNMAYANKYTPNKLVQMLTGTKELNYKDGVLTTMERQNGTMLHTLYQHVSQLTQAAIASIYYRCYEWVSVIDAVTTVICRGRDGNIYVYGEGPLPPAHPRCRSNTIPAECGQPKDASWSESFYTWIRRQPRIFKEDAVGKRAATDLDSGKSKSEDFSKYSASSGISPEVFKGKLRTMLLTNRSVTE